MRTHRCHRRRCRLFRFTFAIPFLCLFACQTRAVFAWHDKGHEVIAAIAWDEMTLGARAAAVALLESSPADAGIRERRPNTGSAEEQARTEFLRAACWADDVRTGPRKKAYHQPFWHFTDYFWEQTTPDAPRQQRPDVPLHGELVTRLPALERSLREPASPPVSPSKGTDLAWFLHLMGDIAQPLHSSGRITAAEPTGDQGGNLFLLSPPSLRGGNGRRPLNLHFFWDHVIEREFGEEADPVAIAREIKARYPRPAHSGILAPGQYETWARRSQRLALRAAYPPTLVRDAEPPAEYRDRVKRTSERVMALAGYRLGATLNAVFAAAAPPSSSAKSSPPGAAAFAR